jgi:phage gpG-like protein
MATTPERAAEILRGMAAGFPAAVAGIVDTRLRFAHFLAVTKYMQGLGTGRDAQPANPPPGPLGIRSGDLRRGVGIMAATITGNKVVGGLRATGPYAAIHEFGGRVPPHLIVARRARALAWVGGTGAVRFAKSVNHPGSTIPARPYMHPALDEAIGDQQEFERQLRNWISSLGAN